MWRDIIVGLAAGVGTTLGIMLFGAAVLWLWVFGDDQWPRWAEVSLVAAAYGSGIAVAASFILSARRRDKPR